MGGCSYEALQILGPRAAAAGTVVLGLTGISHNTNLCPVRGEAYLIIESEASPV